MRFSLYNPNGAWTALATVLAISQDGSSGPLALEPLRRPRRRRPQTEVQPRTWLARLRLDRLDMLLPSSTTQRQALGITFRAQAPIMVCVLDNPAAADGKPVDYQNILQPAVVVSINQPFVLSSGTAWPAWIENVWVYPLADAELHQPDRSVTPVGAHTTTLADLFTKVFGMELPDAADQLLVDVDGLALKGSRRVPWWEPTHSLPGLFRFAVNHQTTSSDRRYSLSVERSPAWTASLQRYQAAVVEATDNGVNVSSPVPQRAFPSVGLAPAALPADLTWFLESSGWVFTPGSNIFEVEFRGIAGGVARWLPDAIHFANDGQQIICASAASPADSSAVLSYAYDRSDAGAMQQNQWSGDFDVIPDPNDLLAALETINPGSIRSDDTSEHDICILTETGALRLAVERPDPKSTTAADVSQHLLKGVFNLTEVPWLPVNPKDASSPLAPDFSRAGRTRLLLMDALGANATFTLQFTGADCACRSIRAGLAQPHLRLEDFIALYLPPDTIRESSWLAPPALPSPVSTDPRNNYFFNLSFVRDGSSAVPAGTAAWRVHVQFKPGQVTTEPVMEGDWQDTSLGISITPAGVERALYWFRPAGLRWIPSLPLYGDPRIEPDRRLCAERTYIPLKPLPNEAIRLGLGEGWPISILEQGRFTMPPLPEIPSESPPLFAWVVPELPGSALALLQNEPIQIEKGRPAGGSLRWLMRYEIPLLDELFALRTLAEAAKAKSEDEDVARPLDGPDWWRELAVLASLARSRRDILMEARTAFIPGDVLGVSQLPVTIQNLYAWQMFPATASLQADPPGMSVDLTLPGSGQTPLIAADRLLEGPTAGFAINTTDLTTSAPLLTPVATAAPAVTIKAGTLVPPLVGDDDSRFAFDQSGRVSYSLPNALGRGRVSLVPVGQPAPAPPMATSFQWSHTALNMSSQNVELQNVDLTMMFAGLPVESNNGVWIFDETNRTTQDEILRDFRWGAIGECRLWGLRYQVMRLERVEFPEPTSAWPDIPIRVVLHGVLHFYDSSARLADQTQQDVRLVLTRHESTWQVESLTGNVLWPLFEATPDLADATRTGLNDPLPWISGPVGIASSGSSAGLTLGTSDSPARFMFRFLDRVWSLPVRLSAGSVTTKLDARSSLTWDLQSAATTLASTLTPIEGQITLRRGTSSSEAGLVFGARVGLKESRTHILAALELALSISPDKTDVTLRRAELLSRAGRDNLVIVTSLQDSQVDISSQQVSAVVTLDAGFRGNAAPFEILPGWPVAPAAALQAYLGIVFAPPQAGVDVTATPIAKFQFLVETTLATPAPLSMLLTASANGSVGPLITIQLTGQLGAENLLTWRTSAGDELRHTVTFTLRQASIPGDLLFASPLRSFFAPQMPTRSDPAGLAGMIELPCLAAHEISAAVQVYPPVPGAQGAGQLAADQISAAGQAGKGRVAAWVAPQRLRLAAPSSFIEEILLRGSQKLIIRSPGMPRVESGLLALYTFTEGSGTTINDRSGTGVPLNLKIAKPDVARWGPDGLTLQGLGTLISSQPATKILQACQQSNEISFEAWLAPSAVDNPDTAYLVTLSKNPDQRGFGLSQGRQGPGIGNPPRLADHYQATVRIGKIGKGDSAILDTAAGTWAASLTHLVYTREASGTARLYINGKQSVSGAAAGNFSGWEADTVLTLASNQNGINPWLGRLRLVAIYRRALTASEVNQNFLAGYPVSDQVTQEQGFVGALGTALAGVLRGSAGYSDTLIMEATEAFWLQAGNESLTRRMPMTLWNDSRRFLAGLPTLDSDFYPLNNDQTQDWVRLPMPFIADTAGVIDTAAKNTPALASLLHSSLPEPGKPGAAVPDPAVVQHLSLLHRSLLDQYSLTHKPLHPGYGSPIDQVSLQPEAFDRVLPYTRPMPGFEPGWLMFVNWGSGAPGAASPASPSPFAVTSDVLAWLKSAHPDTLYIGGTEVVPEASAADLPWQRLVGVDGRPRPYLLASPLAWLWEDVTPTGGQDIRILLEIWIPPGANQWQPTGSDPVLAAREVFRVGISVNDTWNSILFGNGPDPDDTSKVRARVREWIAQEAAAISSTVSPLLRVITLTPAANLSARAYFLLPREEQSPAHRVSHLIRLGSTSQLRPDPRFEQLAQMPPSDPLALGPDYLGGEVYYEERTWFAPERPVAEDIVPGTSISSFEAQPDTINRGQPVTLKWQTLKPDTHLVLGLKGKGDFQDVTGTSLIEFPERTGIYVLRALDNDGNPTDFREVSVVVRVPAAGSAVGMAYKLAGVAPGPAHASRLPWSDHQAQMHRWVEVIRDLMFLDQTRDQASRYEPGWYLPATRAARWASATDRNQSRPFFPTRAIQLLTSGRPGSLMRHRTAVLTEDASGMLRRSASIAYEMRHPRPVPMPPELYPFDPDQVLLPGSIEPRRTCGMKSLDGPAPFHYSQLKWQDPIFNRRLLAVGQEASVDGFVLSLDRSVYAGVDVLYPEVRLMPGSLPPGWRVELTVSLHRNDFAGSHTLAQFVYWANDADGVNLVPDDKPATSLRGIQQTGTGASLRRWVWEIGLDQPAVRDNKSVDNNNFDLDLHNYDEIRAVARVMVPAPGGVWGEAKSLALSGVARTDIAVWPQPQAAYGVLRTETSPDASRTDLVAFGWLPKPKIVKRGNRFDPNSWQGTFIYDDAYIGRVDTIVSYKIQSFTAYGEQAMPPRSAS